MMKKETFTRYELGKEDPDEVQFSIMEMPFFFQENGNKPQLPHIHVFYQIIWFVNGHGTHYVDFKKYTVSSNTIFFISPGQVHHFDEHSDYEGVIIHFNESFLSDENCSENVFLKYNVFNAFDTVPYYKVDPVNIQNLRYFAREMKNEMNRSALFAHKDYLKYMVQLFLISIQRIGRRGTGIPLCINNAANRTFVRFRQMLEHHYRTMHTVKEYSSRLNVSTKTLTNCVYQSSHSTPLTIINDRIILEAKRQLLHSSQKVKEIAFYLGFEDPSYFIKFFKRKTGYSPAEFREL